MATCSVEKKDKNNPFYKEETWETSLSISAISQP